MTTDSNLPSKGIKKIKSQNFTSYIVDEMGETNTQELCTKYIQCETFLGERTENQSSSNPRTCSNCGTYATSTWRNLGDQIVCNACKCFYRKHGKNRPIHMRKDEIITRHRKTCKISSPDEGILNLIRDPNNSNEHESNTVAEAVCMMLQLLQNLSQ